MNPELIILTCTYDRPGRMELLRRCIGCFKVANPLRWIVVEDAEGTDAEVAELLQASGLRHCYCADGPTRDKGHAQREKALQVVAEEGFEGIVYNADDDNWYDHRLFEELRRVRNVAVFPVGNLGPSGIERPVVQDGRLIGWDSGWVERKYPIDMAGFAFHSRRLQHLEKPYWRFRGGPGGESEFIERLLEEGEELEVLCEEGRRCYAWHNEPLGAEDLALDGKIGQGGRDRSGPLAPGMIRKWV